MKRGLTLAELKRYQVDHPWTTRDGLLSAVKAVRKHCVCGYRGDRCDCKFGIKTKQVPSPHNPEKLVDEIDRISEQTGCPELYTVIGLLSVMTKAEFDRLIVKASKR